MSLSRRERRNWRIFLGVNIGAALVSAWFGYTVRSDSSGGMTAAWVGVFTSLIIASPIMMLELWGHRVAVLRRMRRLPLAAYFALRICIYMAIIVGGLALARVLVFPPEAGPFAFDEVFRESIVFGIIMSFAANLVFDLGGLLGFGTLRNLLTGRYVQPKREQRAFLLIDMKDSTGMAERLGPVRFHELLNAFFRDVTDAALECEADIHKYVGDEAILTWPAGPALADGDCLRCPFLAQELIERRREHYLARYGAVPTFRAAGHVGEIVAGEIGDIRREIAYVGDTLNVAARLLEAAKQLGHDILVSEDLLRQAALPAGLAAEPLPTLTVRGRAAPLGIAALRRS